MIHDMNIVIVIMTYQPPVKVKVVKYNYVCVNYKQALAGTPFETVMQVPL